MNSTDFSPNESLQIIQKMIEQRRIKYEENGLFILVWGILVCFAGLLQFLLIQSGKGSTSYLAWVVTLIPGAIITFIAKFKQGYNNRKAEQPTDSFGLIWALAGFMAILTGFFFGAKFGIGFTAMMYAPFCMAAFATALRLNDKVLIAASLLATFIAYASLFIPFVYHPLIAAIIAIVLMIIPGLKLFSDYKKRQRV